MSGRRFAIRSFVVLLISVAAGCGGPPPPIGKPADPDLERSNSAARVAFERGASVEAASLYEQSLARARTMDAPHDIADAAYNLAACLVVLDDLDRARALLHEAEWELARIGGNADDMLLLEAKVARRQGKTTDALALTDQVISRPRPPGSPGPAVGVYVLRGRLALDRHDLGGAHAELQAARVAIKGQTDPITSAGIDGLSARILMEEKQPAQAAAEFEAQIGLLQSAGLYSEMGWALSYAGGAYLAAGRPDLAADRWYRGARCKFSLGDLVQAQKFLASASEAADAAKSTSISGLIHGLKAEMNAATTRPSAATLPSLPTEATPPQ